MHPEPSPAPAAAPLTHEEALEIIARASQDPFLAPRIDAMRQRCCQFIEDMKREVDRELAASTKGSAAALPDEKSANALELRGAAARRQRHVEQRRELAGSLVMGALFNMDNPGWDPATDSLRGNGQGGLLMALIKTSAAWQA